MYTATCKACAWSRTYSTWDDGPYECEACGCCFFNYRRHARIMSRLIFCRYPDCLVGYASVGGDQPRKCPSCGRHARWTTQVPKVAAMSAEGDEPIHPYVITYNDAKFLRRVHIEPEFGLPSDDTPLGGDTADRPDPLSEDGGPTRT